MGRPGRAAGAQAQRLPGYLVPAVVVTDASVDDGKLLINALLTYRNTAPNGYRAPTGPVEKTVAGIFARVLGLERVEDDSFFELGGDSLAAMRVIAAINTALNADLPVRALGCTSSTRFKPAVSEMPDRL